MIPVGTLCYVAGVPRDRCPIPEDVNGRFVTVATELTCVPELEGGWAYGVTAHWIGGGMHYATPRCLRPIAGPGHDPERVPEALDAD